MIAKLAVNHDDYIRCSCSNDNVLGISVESTQQPGLLLDQGRHLELSLVEEESTASVQ